MRSRDIEENAHFEAIFAAQTVTWPDHQWYGDILNCDVCSRPMRYEKFMIDGPSEATRNPRWGNICVVRAYKYSPQIGWGKAQLYLREESGTWRLIAGGPPPHILE